MTTSFRICYPDIPFRALSTTSTRVFDEIYPVTNWISGPRHAYGRLLATATDLNVYYDLGTGNSRVADYFAIGGVAGLRATGNVDAILYGSNDGTSWSVILGTTGLFSTRTFDGPYQNDVIFTSGYNDTEGANNTNAYRYFRVFLNATTSLYPLQKLFFGASFDMGMEPSTYDMEVLTDRDSDTWVAERGHTIPSKAFYPRHRFTIEWDGVTDTKATEFDTTFLRKPYDVYCFLYAANFQDPLYNNRLIYAKLVDLDCSIEKEKDDWNTITAVFEEA